MTLSKFKTFNTLIYVSTDVDDIEINVENDIDKLEKEFKDLIAELRAAKN